MIRPHWDPAADATVAIREDLEPEAYSRMFKKEFDISPREARAEGWLNVAGARPTNGAPALRNGEDRIYQTSEPR